MSIRETILVDTLKYLCWMRLSLISIKNFMISLWKSTTLQPNYKTIPLWCSETQIKKYLLIIIILNQKQSRKPKSKKRKILKTTQEQSMSLSKIRFWVVLVKITWILIVQVSTREWVLRRASKRRKKGKWSMTEYHLRNPWNKSSTVETINRCRLFRSTRTQVSSQTKISNSWYWSRDKVSFLPIIVTNLFKMISIDDPCTYVFRANIY